MSPCLIIAEVGMAHDGSLGLAHSFIDAIAETGADAVKFQCHIAEAESTLDEPWRIKPKWTGDLSRYDYWQRTEFSHGQWVGLAQHARDVGLDFLCSPFSVKAVQWLEPIVEAWKVASGEVGNKPLLTAIGDTRKPVYLSTGMSTYEETMEAESFLRFRGCKVQILQCTSAYPCAPEHVGLDHVKRWRGLSDHSGTIYPGLAAVALGCDVLEVHVCFSRKAFGFDAPASLEMSELRQLVEGVRFIEAALAPVNKDRVAVGLSEMRRVFGDKWRRRAIA